MTIEAEEMIPPKPQQGRRNKRSANTALTVAPEAAAEDAPAALGGNPAVNEKIEALRDLEAVPPGGDHEQEQEQQPSRRQPAPVDFERDTTFSTDSEETVGDADPSVINPFTRQPMEQTESKREVREQRREERQAVNQQTPSTKRFGAVGKKLPGSEHIKVHKRMPNGKLSMVGEYNTADLAQSQDMQSFIYRYVQPNYGYGEYQIFGVDAQGRSFDAGIVELLAPKEEAPPPPAPPNPLDLVQKLMDREAERREQELRLLMQNQKDPIHMLREIHELSQQLNPPLPPMPPLKPSSDNNGQNVMTTMLAGMMQMMTSVLATAMQPRPDPMAPIMVALINKLAERPTPTSVDPTQQLVALSEVAKNLRGNDSGSHNQMVELLMKERMTTNDVLAMVDKFRGERGTDDLKKSIENIGFLLNAVQQVRAHTEPSAGSGFMDVIASALNNPALADVVLSRTRGEQPQQPRSLPAQQPPPRALPANDPLAAKARELAARKLRLEELEIARREQALGVGVKAAPQPPAEPTATAVAADTAVEAAPTEAAAPAAPAAPAASLPPNIANHINAYLAAKSDEEIVKTTFDMVFDMSLDPQWTKYSQILLALIDQSDRGRFLHYMASLFSSLKTIQLINDDLAKRVLECLHNNFEVLVQFTRESVEKLKQAAEEEDEDSDEDDGEDDADGEGEDDPEDLLQLDE